MRRDEGVEYVACLVHERSYHAIAPFMLLLILLIASITALLTQQPSRILMATRLKRAKHHRIQEEV